MGSTACLFDLPIPHQFGDLFWNTVSFSPDETIIGASARSGHVFTWKSTKGTWENPEELKVAQCPMSEGEAYIAFTDERTGRLCRIAEKVGLFEIAHKSDNINHFSGVPPAQVPTLKTFTEWNVAWDAPTSISWSADNSWIISGEVGGGVQCWDQHGQTQFTLYPHSTGNISHTIFG